MAKGRNATARGVENGGGAAASGALDAEVGFAKLQGEDFEYYMQTYSIVLGRNSKTSAVDVDLATLGGGMNISRHHARIFYDFARRRFALEVLGKNGCFVEGVLYVPGTPPVKLDSQDLLQMGDKQFYFLLPTRSIFSRGDGGGSSVHRQPNGAAVGRCAGRAGPINRAVHDDDDNDTGDGEGDDDDDDDDCGIGDDDDDNDEGEGKDEIKEAAALSDGRRLRRNSEDELVEGLRRVRQAGTSRRPITKNKTRSRTDREADNQQLLLLEEKDVITSVANVISELCGPGEWLSLEKLHSELFEEYGNVWHDNRVRKYLTAEDFPHAETKSRPWFGLLLLLRKYPEHFVINTQCKGRVTSEFVSLPALIS